MQGLYRYNRISRYRARWNYRNRLASAYRRLYDTILRRYNRYALSPRRGPSGQSLGPYRPVRHQFPYTEKYNPSPRSKPSIERWAPARKEPIYKTEVLPYTNQLDSEELLKMLEKNLDEKLERKLSERISQEPQTLIELAMKQETSEKEYESEDSPRAHNPDAVKPEQKVDLESLPELDDIEAADNPQFSELPSDSEPLQSVGEENSGIESRLLEDSNDIVSVFHNHETMLPPEEQVSDSLDALEFDLITDPLIRSDIEALLDEAEPIVEPEEEAVESGY